MNNRPTGRNGQRCDCAGYHFPHRKGSLFCFYRQDGTARVPGDTDRNLSDTEIAALARDPLE